jgi:hypothetical protein
MSQLILLIGRLVDDGTSKKSCEIGAKAPIEPTVSVRGILDNVALEPECRTK